MGEKIMFLIGQAVAIFCVYLTAKSGIKNIYETSKSSFEVWSKQKRQEGLHLQDLKLYESELQAAKSTWALIAYFSESDNDKNVFRSGKKDDDGDVIMYFRTEQAKIFFEQLNLVFYEQGHGVFLSKESKKYIFDIRRAIERWNVRAVDNSLEEYAIENKEKLKDFKKCREDLIIELRNTIVVKRELYS